MTLSRFKVGACLLRLLLQQVVPVWFSFGIKVLFCSFLTDTAGLSPDDSL